MTHSIEEMADGIEYEAMRYERTAGKISTEVGKQECLRRVDYLRAAAKAIRDMSEALEKIAESQDAGRHDGWPEPYPVKHQYEMWQIAIDALDALAAPAVAGAGER